MLLQQGTQLGPGVLFFGCRRCVGISSCGAVLYVCQVHVKCLMQHGSRGTCAVG